MKAKFYNTKENAPKPNKPNHIGAVGLIRKKDYFLLERRSDSNRWSFIGGGLKIDESLEDCVTREVFEETGLIVSELVLKALFSNPYRIAEYPDGNILRIITALYEVQVIDDKCVASEESLELRFVKKEDLEKLDIVETHRDIRDYVLNNY